MECSVTVSTQMQIPCRYQNSNDTALMKLDKLALIGDMNIYSNLITYEQFITINPVYSHKYSRPAGRGDARGVNFETPKASDICSVFRDKSGGHVPQRPSHEGVHFLPKRIPSPTTDMATNLVSKVALGTNYQVAPSKSVDILLADA